MKTPFSSIVKKPVFLIGVGLALVMYSAGMFSAILRPEGAGFNAFLFLVGGAFFLWTAHSEAQKKKKQMAAEAASGGA